MEKENTVPHPGITIVLDKLRSAYNAGNIFRLADAVGAKEIIACGYTPCPPHSKLAKTAMGADETVKCRHFDTSLEAVRQLKREGIKEITAVETISGSPCAWEHNYRFPVALIFGNEALGVSADTLNECDSFVSLPMLGNKISINVGNCAAAVLYSILARAKLNK
jgi:tRNA G18 (ribose-2'-O)-methylase SpoU